MASLREEAFQLLFENEIVDGKLPPLSPPVHGAQTTSTVPSASESDECTKPSMGDITNLKDPFQGEDIEPILYHPNEENAPSHGSTTASGKRKRNKKANAVSSATLTIPTKVEQAAVHDTDPGRGLEVGTLASLDENFCPVLAVSKYPYRFVAKELSEVLADAFFNGGKFWERPWDV